MSKDTARKPDKETREAAEPVKERLEGALAEIDTPEKAKAVVERLDKKNAEPAVKVAQEEVPPVKDASPEAQAEVAAELVETAAESEAAPVEKAAAVLETTAAAATALEGPAYRAVAEQVQAVTSPAGPEQSTKLKQARRYLWDILRQHPSINLLDRYDTELFVLINNYSPRSPALNFLFQQLTFWFIGGWGWLIGVALVWPFRPRWAARTLKIIAVPIWVASLVVEGPVKQFFRRRRPFIDIVRAIVVGKKPGNWSFPSGHASAAFAGARMMGHCLPGWRWLWYTIASLIGFSRIYLGAHYPGDVVSGSLLGLLLSEGARFVMRWFRHG